MWKTRTKNILHIYIDVIYKKIKNVCQQDLIFHMRVHTQFDKIYVLKYSIGQDLSFFVILDMRIELYKV